MLHFSVSNRKKILRQKNLTTVPYQKITSENFLAKSKIVTFPKRRTLFFTVVPHKHLFSKYSQDPVVYLPFLPVPYDGQILSINSL